MFKNGAMPRVSVVARINTRDVPAATVAMAEILRRRGASLAPTEPLLFTVRSNTILREGVPGAVTLNPGAVAKVAVNVLCLQKVRRRRLICTDHQISLPR